MSPSPAGSSPDGRQAQAPGLLAELARRIASSLDLQETLQLVVQSVVDQLGFGCALVNMVRPGDLCEVVAVAGSPEAAEALLGTRAPMETWRKILADCEPWGDLRFLDHNAERRNARAVAGWVPPIDAIDAPGVWHPEDILLAPLHAPDGALVGVLSVDLPDDGRHPDLRRRQLLEQFAVHAALAIEHARVHTLIADSEQLFRAMFDRSPIAIALISSDHRIVRVNEACERLLGRAAVQLMGTTAPELSRPDLGPGRRAADKAANSAGQYEIHFTRPDGSDVWGRVNSTQLASSTGIGPHLMLTQIEDITVLRAMQARFAYAATHDRLTGLANRALVHDRLAAALKESRQARSRVAVLFCDLDRFKEINDTLGHAAGDQLLVEISRRLELTAAAQETVGRLGGDEFILIGRPMRTPAHAIRWADRVMLAIRQPLRLCGEPITVSLSIGITLSTSRDSPDSVLASADRALYAAKRAGRGQWRLDRELK
jgi:diguanylate cyclase (GGDEF)-like protein/PAS domain S-box-containing protein